MLSKSLKSFLLWFSSSTLVFDTTNRVVSDFIRRNLATVPRNPHCRNACRIMLIKWYIFTNGSNVFRKNYYRLLPRATEQEQHVAMCAVGVFQYNELNRGQPTQCIRKIEMVTGSQLQLDQNRCDPLDARQKTLRNGFVRPHGTRLFATPFWNLCCPP